MGRKINLVINQLLKNFKELLLTYRALGFESLPIQGVPIPELSLIATVKGHHRTKEEKELALKLLREEIGDCHRCKLYKGRKNIVFGEGNPDTRLMFIGEGPGADEDIQGRPFVGRAGQLLTRLINRMGFKREDVYIANIVKCRPPNNRNPQSDEIGECFGFLEQQIEIISPDVIMSLGNVATKVLLSTEKKISELRGKFHDYKGIKVMPSFHPSYLLRNANQKWLTWNDALKVLKLLGIEVISK